MREVGATALRFHAIAEGWRGLYRYVGSLAETRDRFEGDGRFEGPLAPVRKSALAVRFWARNRLQRVMNVRRLARARSAPRRAGEGAEPLVSVVIPTHNRCALLTERAIPSVLAQTYRNIELIVVGDRCTDDTEEKARALEHVGVRYISVDKGAGRPEGGYDAWLYAGVDASNAGLALCSGEWILHLDDDDELAPRCVEALLGAALEGGFEMVYGKVMVVTASGEAYELGSFPPEMGKMTHSGAAYSSRLRFFSYDRNAWKYLEPCDWSLWRRMKEAGVRMGFVDSVLGSIYPAGPGFYCDGPPGCAAPARRE